MIQFFLLVKAVNIKLPIDQFHHSVSFSYRLNVTLAGRSLHYTGLVPGIACAMLCKVCSRRVPICVDLISVRIEVELLPGQHIVMGYMADDVFFQNTGANL